ncbi:MAG: PEP-CTERM sorting domain-containing protein [Akkermansia sp.]|nr:PEP-CTERM sorting domain-containing protein [Akkermansia sp.]
MEKTIIALLALGSAAMAADVTAHDITFKTADLTKGFHIWADLDTTNYYITDGEAWGNGNGGYEFGGLYVDNEGGMKFNTGNADFTVKYLYLTSDVKIGTSTRVNKGEINWSNNNGANFVMADGGWVDINAAYGDKIDASGMNSGSIYLNDAGSLTLSALKNGVNVYANVTAGEDRTLISGNMSNWAGSMTLTAGNSTALFEGGQLVSATGELENIKINATAEGLSYSFETPAAPEPTTATLSLLALAGLAARRRRK